MWLSGHNGKDLYNQRIVPDYAHMDLFIGRNASREVTPLILEELEKLDQKSGAKEARKRA